jgi:hypothetical protein
MNYTSVCLGNRHWSNLTAFVMSALASTIRIPNIFASGWDGSAAAFVPE